MTADQDAAGAAGRNGETVLYGRAAERARLDELLDAARAGRSGALVLHGGAGVGKSALLDDALARAAGWRTARTTGVAPEAGLAFAGLHRLCQGYLDRLDRLPAPQARALRAAFRLHGDGDAAPPDRLHVGLAVHGLLADAARDRPLLCTVDDAQWLDEASAQALGLVARRLDAGPVVMLFAVRDLAAVPALAGLPALAVGGLRRRDAGSLLASVLPGPIDATVRERILAETRGTPLAILELLPDGSAAGELAGGFGVPRADRIEGAYRRTIDALPAATRHLLQLAAAEPSGDPVLLWRAARLAGCGPEDAAPAEAAGLLHVGERVTFPHPRVRSAVYAAAPPDQRAAVHRALAAAIDPTTDPDRRAWHLAQATAGPDEAVAGDLEGSAERAFGRGGVAAAAAFLDRATSLSPDSGRRADRALAAAKLHLAAGAPDTARRLLTVAAAAPPDRRREADLQATQAEVAYFERRGPGASRRLLDAARRLAPVDPLLSRETYAEALEAALLEGRFGIGVPAVARAARAAPPMPPQPRPVDLLLDGLVAHVAGDRHGDDGDGHDGDRPGGEVGSVARLRHAVQAVVDEGDLRWVWLAAAVAVDLWDRAAWQALADRGTEIVRRAGARHMLPFALHSRAGLHVLDGDLAAAGLLNDEAAAVTAATGNAPILHADLALAAIRGDDEAVDDLVRRSVEAGRAHGEGAALTLAEWATALIHNAHGRHDDAFRALRGASHDDEIGYAVLSPPELVEAAALTGRRDTAAAALARLAEKARASGTDWARGVEARCRGLVSGLSGDGDATHRCYEEAVDRLDRAGTRLDRTRAELLHGEWLSRRGRRRAAVERLCRAHASFAEMGARAFAQRAAARLQALGVPVTDGAGGARPALTVQEAEIARLAATGLSNPDIAARMFLSPKTVEYHLRKVFVKLGVSSRRQLPAALDPPPAPGMQAEQGSQGDQG